MHEKLQFRQDKKTQSHADFEPQLRALQLQLEGFRNSFEYISDYVNLYPIPPSRKPDLDLFAAPFGPVWTDVAASRQN